MAKFCTQCGRALADGEVCSCQQQQRQEVPHMEAAAKGMRGAAGSFETAGADFQRKEEKNAQQETAQQEPIDILQVFRQISKKIGNALDAVYNFFAPAKRVTRFSNMIPVRNLLGFSQEDRVSPMGDCYERNKKIVPDLIQPCGQEIPIRQYDLCCCRSLLRGLWQEGKMQVTNKRVLFRLSGRNWIGKAQTSVEFSLDEIAGMDIRTSNKLSGVTLLINILLSAVFTGLGAGFVRLSPKAGAVIGFLLLLLVHILVRRHYYFKYMVTGFCLPCMMIAAALWESGFWKFALTVTGILLIVYLLVSSLKPSLDISVLAKCNTSGPIEIKRQSIWERMFVFGMEVLPGRDAVRAMDEVGTMINDIQRFGDYGIEKWKEE